jgi:CBS domain-containing protein
MTGFISPILDALPHIFKRPLISVGPEDSLLQVGTYLAIGPQIYVDGLVVIDNSKKPIGTISSKHMIEHILYHRSDWLAGKASTIMGFHDSAVDARSPVNNALDMFAKTGFGFAPVTINNVAVTSISLRDTLKIVSEQGVDTSIVEIASPSETVEGSVSIGDALQIMLDQGIRILIAKSKRDGISSLRILNDRKILEFLFSHEGRQLILSKGIGGLFDIPIDTLDMLELKKVRQDMSVSTAAALFEVNVPCLLVNGSIVTPWDIVMKNR